ncbi:bifunctional diguanylate cyclase/phosphodiesterase [Massilia sp. TS11]|uniref:putative bifunctional diguanylate cyclase/phosphodiesterase n=1 Tax=Massilia sp. TS11 TaxID=2908003 RepID=UPI001ED9F068|nr:EAL domain-containing protein [Massilia sp. TS11]MCG2584130.1 EAL domain-containing protein [Massilia sp. TS11]
MMLDPALIAARAAALMPSAAAIAEQLAFLEFGPEDAARLRAVHDGLLARQRDYVDQFFAHLMAVPRLAAMLGTPDEIAQTVPRLLRHFSDLTLGDYGPAYVQRRLKVGVVHNQIGLEPGWYIAAYRKYLDAVTPVLRALLPDAEAFAATHASLLKIVAFDMSLAIDTYIGEGRAELADSEARFRAAFGQAAVGLSLLDSAGRWLRVNQKLLDILGYAETDLLGSHYLALACPDDPGSRHDALQLLEPGGQQHDVHEHCYLHRAGHRVWVRVTIARMEAGDGTQRYVAVSEDISQRKAVEQRLDHLHHYDELTGLSNRALMIDRLSQAMTFAGRANRHVGVLFIDLDRFKYINDSLGHAAGDTVIIEAAQRLRRHLREGDTVARTGGDEFVVLMSDVVREDEVALQAQRLLDALRDPMHIFGHELAPVASMGISLYPKDGADTATLLMNADAALYRAKDHGRNQFAFYTEEMNARTLDRLRLESGLRQALARGELYLVYQPQMHIASGRITGVEALLRWRPAGQAEIPPSEFIPIAEETGLIESIGEWVLRTACAQMAAWRRAGLQPGRVAVNLSARQFRQRALQESVANILRETGCPPQALELEITESVIMENPEMAIHALEGLSQMGVALAVDDFGTGYSSLAYLKRFPIDALKIDRSFVRDITTDIEDAAIARAVIVLAHSLRLAVIAEGVETAEQLAYLHEQRCDQIQGYYLARPLSPEAFADMVRVKTAQAV